MGRRDRRAARGWGAGSGGSFVPLSLTAVSPDIGFAALAGTTAPFLLTAAGVGFTPATTFTIGGIAVGTPTFVSPTTFTFFAPTLAGIGDYDVVATRGGSTSTLAAYYRCEPMFNWYRGDVWTAPSWTDLSGNGRHAVQAVGASQPFQEASTYNGLPGITGDAVADSLLAPTSINSATHQTYLAMRPNANTVGNEGIFCLLGVGAVGDNSTPNSFAMYRGGTNIAVFSNPNVLCTTAGTANGVGMCIESLFTGTNHVSRVNATTGTPVATSAVMNADRINLFSRWLAGVPAIWGPYTECEVLFGPLSSAGIRTRIRTRFANRHNQANFI